MFHQVPKAIEDRMHYLREIDKKDRQDGTTHAKRLRQIPPETGRFISVLAACAPEGKYIEIGTSGGYSTLWLSLACREVGRKITTFEILQEKADLARETFNAAEVEDVVELVHADARVRLDEYNGLSFCFLDPAKEIYSECYDRVIPNMVKGGILVADNAISHEEVLGPFLERVMKDERVDALVVPIGSGELVCRKT
jgi:predicted O-methyltransferase YrrM